MFFMLQDLHYLLKCSVCSTQLNESCKRLPCDEWICEQCAECLCLKLNEVTRAYACDICNEIHYLPIDGLPSSKTAKKLLQMKPRKIFRGGYYEKYLKSLDSLKTVSHSFEYQLQNDISLVKQYFEDLKEKVILNRDSACEHINNISKAMLDEIDANENQALHAYQKNGQRIAQKRKYVDLVNKVSVYQEKAAFDVECDVLNDDKILKKKSDEAQELVDHLKKKAKVYNSMLFSGKILTYEPNEQFKISTDLLGSLKKLPIPANVSNDTSFIQSEDEQSKNSLRMYYRVKNFKPTVENSMRRIISKTYTLNGLDWCIEVAQRKKDYLGIFIHCYKSKEEQTTSISNDWKACAKIIIKLINSKDVSLGIIKECKNIFFEPTGNGWGWDDVITMDELFHADSGFYNSEGDSISIKAIIDEIIIR